MGDIQFFEEVQQEEEMIYLSILQKMQKARNMGFNFTIKDIQDTQRAFGLTTEFKNG